MARPISFSHLVVVGSSAGGIDALSTLVSTLPADFPAPIVLAQHLDPNRPSHLADILGRRSTLPVQTAGEHEPLVPGMIYVVPANRQVEISDSEITLQEENVGRFKPSIDRLLSSAAEVYGERLIAVILSGTGSDGAAGARAVKKTGGT
ncbi:MAG TPA: chemotaxis protein CheB, partial [Ktedonobacterales bacterium]